MVVILTAGMTLGETCGSHASTEMGSHSHLVDVEEQLAWMRQTKEEMMG